ncbi:MAG: hypothetical protein HON53_00795 [Planctomycetaceae bacterium]|nr:hypothetical protein [Planctomycetaceae bacterium]MBT6155444.1 hypothetical protein [Planctomycetaceae bacterium]MBT6485631.1 hypothetical protein [Planctomycetaceae bacterium]MBT6494980.1 hypothetical protein [Planctomycetaceae bacterium]
MTSSDSIGSQRTPPRRPCAIDCFATAWTLGTGLPTSLKPGDYNITDSIRVDGVRYVTLNGQHRVAADSCKTA